MSDDHPCTRCSAPASVWPLCFECAGKIRTELVSLAWLCRQLQVSITRQAQIGDPYRDGGKATETPLMFDDNASEAAWVTRNTLRSWGAEIGEYARDEDTALLAVRLAAAWYRLAALPDASQCLDEITQAAELATRAVDRPEVRVYLGNCHCGRRIHADPSDDEVVCGACSKVHPVAELREGNRHTGSQIFVTAREAELYLGEVYGVQVTARRIRVWAARKAIQTYEGKVYKVADILAKLQRTNLSG